jgi:hypothetical protein
MRILAITSLLLCAIPAGSWADKPKVTRAMVKAMETSMDNQLTGLWPTDPVQVLGLSQGVYVNGYGAVFMSEVNLAPAAGITPFHPTFSADELKQIHAKKLQRLPKLKEAMQQIMLNSASSLDSVAADEQIAVGITLFYWTWEDKAGLPAQIVMHAPKRALLLVKTGDKATLAGALTVEEF